VCLHVFVCVCVCISEREKGDGEEGRREMGDGLYHVLAYHPQGISEETSVN